MEDWDNLRFYLAVARYGTVSRAAQRLQVSHATVLRRVDQLEHRLGTRLFKRLQSGYLLSEAGQNLLPQALAIEENMQALAQSLQKRDSEMAGLLRVTQPENDVLNLYPLYAQFLRQYPQVQLEIEASSEVANLNRREVDVAIRFTNNPPELLVGQRLSSRSYGAFASEAYLQQLQENPGLSDYDWLVWQQKGRPLEESPQYRWLMKNVAQPKIRLRATSVSDLISAMRAGIGAGFIALDIVDQYPGLVPIEKTRISSAYQLWILCHREARDVARIKTFMRFIYEAMQPGKL